MAALIKCPVFVFFTLRYMVPVMRLCQWYATKSHLSTVNRCSVRHVTYAASEQCWPLFGADLFYPPRRYTAHHLPLFSLAYYNQTLLQLHLSSGKLLKLVKRNFFYPLLLDNICRTMPLSKLVDLTTTCTGILKFFCCDIERTISLAGNTWKYAFPNPFKFTAVRARRIKVLMLHEGTQNV